MEPTTITHQLNLELVDEKVATFFNEDNPDSPIVTLGKQEWDELGRPSRLSVELKEYRQSFLTVEDL